jgi:hypothetical protein
MVQEVGLSHCLLPNNFNYFFFQWLLEYTESISHVKTPHRYTISLPMLMIHSIKPTIFCSNSTTLKLRLHPLGYSEIVCKFHNAKFLLIEFSLDCSMFNIDPRHSIHIFFYTLFDDDHHLLPPIEIERGSHHLMSMHTPIRSSLQEHSYMGM